MWVRPRIQHAIFNLENVCSIGLPDDEVLRLSGFNALWGPQQFLDHLVEHGGECAYLLYVRSSDPIQKLRRPEECIEHPLLGAGYRPQSS